MSIEQYIYSPKFHNNKIYYISNNDIWVYNQNLAFSYNLNLGIIRKLHIYGNNLFFEAGNEKVYEIYQINLSNNKLIRLTYLGENSSIQFISSNNNFLGFTSSLNSFNQTKLYILDLNTNKYKKVNNINSQHIKPLNNRGEFKDIDEYINHLNNTYLLVTPPYQNFQTWNKYNGGMKSEFFILNKKTISKLKINNNFTHPCVYNDFLYFIRESKKGSEIVKYPIKKSKIDITKAKTILSTNHIIHDFDIDKQENIIFSIRGSIFINNINNKIKTNPNLLNNLTPKSYYIFDYINSVAIDDYENDILIESRGRVFKRKPWKSGVTALKPGKALKLRDPDSFSKNKVIVIGENVNNDCFIIYNKSNLKPSEYIRFDYDFHIIDYIVSSNSKYIVFSTNKNDIYLYIYKEKKLIKIDFSEYRNIEDISISENEKLISYTKYITHLTSNIFIYEIDEGIKHTISQDIFSDFAGEFSDNGRYFVYLSSREMNPSFDSFQNSINYTLTYKPMFIDLTDKPIIPIHDKIKYENNKFKYSLDNLTARVFQLPLAEKNYQKISMYENKLYILSDKFLNLAKSKSYDKSDKLKPKLEIYNLDTNEKNTIEREVEYFELLTNSKKMVLFYPDEIRLVNIDDELSDEMSYSEKDGWIDLNQGNILIDQNDEWNYLFLEMFRLQKLYFWKQNNINWDDLLNIYKNEIKKVSNRYELSLLIKDFFGKLSSSHLFDFHYTYDDGRYDVAKLGCSLIFEKQKVIINEIFKGYSWDFEKKSLLNNYKYKELSGSQIISINGNKINTKDSLGKYLIYNIDKEIEIELEKANKKIKLISKPLNSIDHLLEQNYIDNNKKYISANSKNSIGYIFIPDMTEYGYSQFIKQFIQQMKYENLIIDIRGNSGGFVSDIIIQKLKNKVIGWDQSINDLAPHPYPEEAVLGNIVLITDRYCSSDGEIFAYAFRKYNLGKIVGEVTWGGTVGINPRFSLIDGSYITHPEFNFLTSSKKSFENIGVKPDYLINIEDSKQDCDIFIDKAIEILS